MASKVCVITGASRGIGLATALRFSNAGYAIVAAARDESKLNAAADRIRGEGGVCETVTADVGEPAQARGIVERAVEKFGRVDVLVNNAGFAPLVPLPETSVDDFDRVLRINVSAVFHTTQAAWPTMVSQGGGVIVNISSLASVDPLQGFAAYGPSKAWVNLFTKAVAAEGKPHGIRVYAVAPGAVETEMLRSVAPDIDAKFCLAPDDIAAAIESLCGDPWQHSTGQTIFVRR